MLSMVSSVGSKPTFIASSKLSPVLPKYRSNDFEIALPAIPVNTALPPAAFSPAILPCLFAVVP